jgi:hypothetical protein
MANVRELVQDIDQTASTATVAETRGSRRAWFIALMTVILTHLIFMGVAWSASWLLSSGRGPSDIGLLEMWYQFDAEHLLKVAEFGYTDPRTFEFSTVFFPLFPLLVKALGAVGIPLSLAGLLIPGAASVVAFAYLFRLAEEEIGPGSGRSAVMLLAFFPTGLFLIAPYTEALFLAGAIPAFYYARKGQWSLVALPAAIAMGARNTGIFLIIGLVIEALRQRPPGHLIDRTAIKSLVIGTLPLILYCSYLLAVFGDPLHFITDYNDGWNRGFTDPFHSLVTTLGMTEIPAYPTNWMMAARGELVALCLGVGVVTWAVVRKHWGYAAYSGTLLAVLLTGPFLYSTPRALLQLFPVVLMIVEGTRERAGARDAVLVGSTSLAVLGAIVFTQGGWFY